MIGVKMLNHHERNAWSSLEPFKELAQCLEPACGSADADDWRAYLIVCIHSSILCLTSSAMVSESISAVFAITQLSWESTLLRVCKSVVRAAS